MKKNSMLVNNIARVWLAVKGNRSTRRKPIQVKPLTSTVSFILIMIVLVRCDKKPNVTATEGFVDVKGGKIWYSVVGEGGKTPVVLLHGGPGYPSYYLNPLLDLKKERPVIIFDQLGCGRSDAITDTTLMTIDNYVEQVRHLLHSLNIEEFYLYGHSWGAMLATDYYLKYPSGIKGLILASPCLSAKRWVSDADSLISTLPDTVQMILRNDIHGLIQDPQQLSAAMKVYYNNFYSRKQPSSAEVDSSNAQTGFNVYQYMWGSSEFFATGTLKNYDRTADLKNIDVPTLYLAGEFDEAPPVTVKYYRDQTPNARLKVIRNAGHLTMQDNPGEDITAISEFLNELDR